MGGYEHDSKPAFLPDGTGGFDEIPPDFNGRLLEDEPDRFEEIAENSKIRVPAMKDAKITKLINGPEAFTPDNEFCLGETEVGGLLRRRRVLRPRSCRSRRHRNGHGRVDLGRRAVARPLDAWTCAASAPTTARPPTRTPASARRTRPTTTSATRTTSGRRAAPCGSRPANAWHREHGAAFGEKSGWERVNWYESNAERGDESPPPARLGRDALVARDRR